MTTHAGQLKHLLTIQAKTVIDSPTGEPVLQWANWRTVRASRVDVAARERFAAEQVIAPRTVVFTMRWLPGITAEHRGLCEGELWDFTGLAAVGDRPHQWLQISAEFRGTAA